MLRTVLCTHAAPTTPVDRRWASVDSLAHLLSGFPRVWDGSASTTQMSGPAQASLTLRPACLLDLLSGPLSQGFAVAVTRLPSLGFSAPDSYRGVSTELLGRDFHPLERCTFMAHPDMLPLAKVLAGPLASTRVHQGFTRSLCPAGHLRRFAECRRQVASPWVNGFESLGGYHIFP